MNNLKVLREKNRITQEALAKRVGLTQEAISHYESGRRVPSLSRCRDIVRALISLGSACCLSEAFPDRGDISPNLEEMIDAGSGELQGGVSAVQASSGMGAA